MGATELLLILLLLGSIALPIAAIIAASALPDSAWNSAGRRRLPWVVTLVLLGFACAPVGALVALAYFFGVHPKVKVHAPPGSRGSV